MPTGPSRYEEVEGVAVQFLDEGVRLFALEEPGGMDEPIRVAETAPETRGRAGVQSGLRLARDFPDRPTTVEVGLQSGRRFADRSGVAGVTVDGDTGTLGAATAFAGELTDEVLDPERATNPLGGPEPSVHAVDLTASTWAVDVVPDGFPAAEATLPDDEGRVFGNPGLADVPADREAVVGALGDDVARLHLRDDADLTAGHARSLPVRERDDRPVVVAGAGAGVADTVAAVAENPSAEPLSHHADAGVVWLPFHDGATRTPAVVDERVDPSERSPARLAAACSRAADGRIASRGHLDPGERSGDGRADGRGADDVRGGR